jgi:hypothetical protein
VQRRARLQKRVGEDSSALRFYVGKNVRAVHRFADAPPEGLLFDNKDQ